MGRFYFGGSRHNLPHGGTRNTSKTLPRLYPDCFLLFGFRSSADEIAKVSGHPRSQVFFTMAAPVASSRYATRLTAHPGVEVFAKFSPDGKWIAFTGQYDGDEQVYVMPSDGRRAEAADLLSGARAANAALGLRQPGLRLDDRRQAHPVPLASAIRGRCR